MSAVGAKYKWNNGKILHASRLWKAPTMRRVPRILIEDRAKEVGIKIHIEEPWMIFEETEEKCEEISMENSEELEFYLARFHLLPSKFHGIDTYDWLKKQGNSFLLWAKGNRYYIRPQIN
jgi:hypothetical protein